MSHRNTFVFLSLATVMLLSPNRAYAEDGQTAGGVLRPGIGLDLVDIMQWESAYGDGGANIYLPMRYKDRMLFEPCVGLYNRSYEQKILSETLQMDERRVTLGLAWFGIKQGRLVDWLFGFRMEKSWLREEVVQGEVIGIPEESTGHQFVIGPVIAAELNVFGVFSISGEIQLMHTEFSRYSGDFTSSEESTRATVMLRYYVGW